MITIKKNIKNFINFFDPDIFYYSASLSFFTIMSILPILALILVGLSYLSGMPIFDGVTEHFIKNSLELINPTKSAQLQETIINFLSNTKDLGMFGLFYLLFAFGLFFRDYDYIINKIYKIKQKKLYKMVLTYFSFLIILPIGFLLFTMFVAIFKIAFFDNVVGEIVLRFFTAWIMFILLFKISINTKIKNTALFLSTFLTVIALSFFKYMFLFYVSYNKMYATIYGSFSVLMLFFIWLYISWIIFLFGIKLSKTLQRYETFSFLWYNAKEHL
ncbi:MAG: hypothetical protein B1H07_04875 [Campylobacteraceae bacterium 4484_166]|nr:MAG: hypothetical protein B1H07_04875 [Campylobacteraceae bacterium 4484_166]